MHAHPHGLGDGHTSYATVSLATAAKALSQCHRTVSSLASTPHDARISRSGSACFSASDSAWYASSQPVRISRISPPRNVTPYSATTASSSASGIEWRVKGEKEMLCLSA